MLTIGFSGHPKARAIVVDEPVNGVIGIVECSICSGGLVLTPSVVDIDSISSEIEQFIREHKCKPLAREVEVIAFAEKLKKSLPSMLVKVTKGRKTIKEF